MPRMSHHNNRTNKWSSALNGCRFLKLLYLLEIVGKRWRGDTGRRGLDADCAPDSPRKKRPTKFVRLLPTCDFAGRWLPMPSGFHNHSKRRKRGTAVTMVPCVSQYRANPIVFFFISVRPDGRWSPTKSGPPGTVLNPDAKSGRIFYNGNPIIKILVPI